MRLSQNVEKKFVWFFLPVRKLKMFDAIKRMKVNVNDEEHECNELSCFHSKCII